MRHHFVLARTGLFVALLALATPAHALDADANRAAPEPATVGAPGDVVTATRHIVSTAHPLASHAARAILRQGGSAVDSAIAAQMVLGLVEPQSSGLGGGAFLVHYEAATGEVTSWDGRETAPAAAQASRFLDADGAPRRWPDVVPGGLSVGVPGLVAMLHAAHERHGTLAWDRLFEDGVRLARGGFGVSPRLSSLLDGMGPDAFSPEARSYFFDEDGEALPLGHVLRNPDYAATLDRIAGEGPSAFYDGEISAAIAEAVTGAWVNEGDMTAEDLAAYRAVERPAVCAPYREYRICGMGPPSSGGLAVAMSLAMLDGRDLGDAPSPEALHLIGEALNLAFADRDHYVGDPDFVAVPSTLLDAGYLALRAATVDASRTGGPAEPGMPPGTIPGNGIDGTIEGRGTSQISVVDAAGNAVSLTTTIESAFGSRLMAAGFLLNNELTDFAFAPADQTGRPAANRAEAGKRPRSSMAPTIVLDSEGELRMVLGSPGGSRIIPYVVKAVVAHLDWGMDAQESAALFNFGSRNGPFEIEETPGAGPWTQALAAFGHEAVTAEMTSGLNVIVVTGERLEAGSDPRREGLALGD